MVVPVRNEERNLPGCLQSLVRQSEPGFALGREWELVIVNDDSTDRTREIAEEAARAHPATEIGAAMTVLDAPALDTSARGGFTGKNAACWAGAQIARGRRILFTDADTMHEPGALSRSLREAEKHGVALLSYSPRQIVTGLVQRTVMPLIFSELANVYPPAQVNDPRRRIAAANGQFLLVDRAAYFDLGGHRAVGPSVLEDVALASKIKRAQRPIRFRYAPEALSTRMYRSTPEMVEGWTKNLAIAVCRGRSRCSAFWRVLDVVLFFGLPQIALSACPTCSGNRPMWQPGLVWVICGCGRLVRFYGRVAAVEFSGGRCGDVDSWGYRFLCGCWCAVRFVHHRVRKVAWGGKGGGIGWGGRNRGGADRVLMVEGRMSRPISGTMARSRFPSGMTNKRAKQNQIRLGE